MTVGPEWVPFTHRYGIATYLEVGRWCDWPEQRRELPEELWRCRHSREIHVGQETDPLFRCVCPGSGLSRDETVWGCKQRASQEDRLCDACREHCWAVDGAGEYHRLVHVYGATS